MKEGSTEEPVRNIVIVGGGTAGWMTAAVLSQWMTKVRIRLIESDEIGTIGVGEATIPHIQNFFTLAGVDVLEIMATTKATFKLGIQFVDWGAPGESYVHGFGKIGRDLLWLHPHQLWLAARSRRLHAIKSFDHYSINAFASLKNKFSYADRRNPQSPLADIDHAFHFDASLLAGFLRGQCQERGVERIEGKVVGTVLHQETGFLEKVVLSDGRDCSADLFIDCSGMRGLLIGDAFEVPYEDWDRWLLCDRAQAVPCESASPLTPYTRSTARTAGWQWRIPLQHRTGNGLVYASALMSDDAASDSLLRNLDGRVLAAPRPVRFRPGRRLRAWHKNVIAVGLSAGFLEPLESTSIHLIQTAVQRLLALFPARGFTQADIDEYNRQSQFEYEDVRDFIIAHYNVTRRNGEPFWDYVRNMSLPDTLESRYDLFRSSGRFFKHGAAELFAEESWVQMLLGQGFPMTPDPVTQFVPDADLTGFLRDLEEVIADTVNGMADHAAFIANLPRSSAGASQALRSSAGAFASLAGS